jgi:hypothetical protein
MSYIWPSRVIKLEDTGDCRRYKFNGYAQVVKGRPQGQNAVVNQRNYSTKGIIAESAVNVTETEPPESPPDENEPKPPIAGKKGGD